MVNLVVWLLVAAGVGSFLLAGFMLILR